MTQVVVVLSSKAARRASPEGEAWELDVKRDHTGESWSADSKICLSTL